MISKLKLYTNDLPELKKFLNRFFSTFIPITTAKYWEREFENPLDMIYIISSLVDNNDQYPSISIWVSIDPRYLYKHKRR